MDDVDNSAAPDEAVNSGVVVSSELEGSADAEDGGIGVAHALEESVVTLLFAESSRRPGVEDCDCRPPASKSEVLATELRCSSPGVGRLPSPGETPFESRKPEVDSVSVCDSRTAEHSATSKNGSVCATEGLSRDGTQVPSIASLTVNSSFGSSNHRASTSQDPDPRIGLDCGRTRLALGEGAPAKSEEMPSASLEVSTASKGSRVVPGGRLSIGAADILPGKIVAGDAQQPASSQNVDRQMKDKSNESSHLPSPCSVERMSRRSVIPEGSATALMQGHGTPCSSSSYERGETVGKLPSTPMPYTTGDEGTYCSQETSGGTSTRVSPSYHDCQSTGETRNTLAPGLGAGRNGLGVADVDRPTPAMTTEENVVEARGGCLADQDQAINVEQEVEHTDSRDAAMPAVNAVETMASAALGCEGANSHSTTGPSASPRSWCFSRDEACGASESGVAQKPQEPGPASTEPSTLFTSSTNVAVARTPFRVLSTISTPPSGHTENSYMIAPRTAVSQDVQPDSGVTGPSRQARDLPTEGCAMISSAEHLAPLSRGGEETRLEAHTESEGIASHDSTGDTADVALAAFSYANAVAEEENIADPTCGTTAGLLHTASGEVVQSVSHGAGGGSSVSAFGERHTTVNSTADSPAMSQTPSEESEGVGISSSTIGVASEGTRTASRATSTCEAAFHAKTSCESALASASGKVQGGGGSTRLARAAKGGKAARSKSDNRDDLMHAMCMICLEKLSDAGEGGGAKLLGLLDSCSHRYCYTCILEWSKITNKCPQCKARFHTIKAVKELRRKNERYRGIAVRVEDRDQVYSFVDVRDVVVLDPGVACHVGCLVRRGVDALHQGWEFSVQCEQCSKWYHGLCVGFRQEWQVPDIWFCRPCRGESYEIVLNPEAITEPAAIIDRSRASQGGSRGGNRGQDGGRSRGGPVVVPQSVSAQGGSGEVARGHAQLPEQGTGPSSASAMNRTALDGHPETVSTSYGGAAATDAVAAQQAPANAATPAPRGPFESPPPSLPPIGTAPGGGHTQNRSTPTSSSNLPPSERTRTSMDARQQERTAPPPAPSTVDAPSTVESISNLSGGQQQAGAVPSPSNSSPRPPLPASANSAPPVSPPVIVPPARGRGRPRGSRNKPTGSQLPQAPRQISAHPTPSAPAAARTPLTATTAPPGAAAPARARGRPRGSKNKPKVQAAAQPTARPPAPAISAPQPGRRSASPPSAESPASTPGGVQQQQHEEQVEEGEGTAVEELLPHPPEPPSPSLLRSLDESSVTDLCEICGFDTEPDNLIVYCESCNMGVHQTCYGISEIPTKEWYCSPCSAGVHPSTLACRFCPVKGGALKRCTDDSWGHILCAFWIPECCFIDPQKMEPIGSINRRGKTGGVETFLPNFRSRKCYICGTSAGSAIRCHSASCKFHLHPMCGSKAGTVYMEIETTMKRGADGTEHESVSLVAKCPRHNKSKAVSGRPQKGRPTLASATDPSATDPLSVLGKTLEITDPERGDAIALAGKVTWYNPDRSKYCVVTARLVGEGEDPSSSGEPKEGFSHWITVDKLVEAGAMGVLKGGKKFLLQPLPSFEEEGTELSAGNASEDNGVKAEGGSSKPKAGKESGVLSAEDGSENKDAVVYLEGMMSEEEDVGAVVRGKRRRIDAPVPPIGSPDPSVAKRPAHMDVGSRQARLAPGFDLLPPQPVPGALPSPSSTGESSPSFSEHRVVAESEGESTKRSTEVGKSSLATRCPTQQQDRLLPSVQFAEQDDPFSRYPIRGRLRRQTQPAFEESRAIQRLPSIKRQRVAGEVGRSPIMTVDTGSDSSSDTKTASTGGAKVTDCVHSTPSGTSDRVRLHRKSLSPPSTQEPMVRVEVHETRERGSAYSLEPGWPDGMQFLGQVPVMHVHAVRVRSDGDAMYYAGAYKDAESMVSYRRSAPKFSFRFEGVKKLSHGIGDDSTDSHEDLGCEIAGEQRAREGEDSTQEGTGSRETQQGEAPRAPRVGASPPESLDAKENGGKGLEDEMMPDDGVEEGEIDALPVGQAGVMHPSCRLEKRIGGDDARVSVTGVRVAQETAKSGGIPSQAATGNARNQSSVPSDGKRAAEVEEMEISSDDASYFGFEGVEVASSCISEYEASDADARATDDRGREGAAEPSNVGTNTNVPTLLGGGSAASQSYASAATKPNAGEQIKSAAAGEQTMPLKSCMGSMSRLGNETPAVEQEPEIAPVQALSPRETEAILSLRSIVRKQLQGVLRSVSKGKEAALIREDANDVIEEIADDAEDMLFRLLYRDSTGGREYKAKYKQLMLALGNVRNYRLVASVLAGSTTPADLATKDAVGLLNSLSSSLNCLAMPLAGRHRQGSQPCSPASDSQKGKGKRRGKMQLL